MHLQELSPESDRVVLTVRLTKDGHREYLSSDSRTAVVFHECGCWYARREEDPGYRAKFYEEIHALTWALAPRITHLRDTRRTDL